MKEIMKKQQTVGADSVPHSADVEKNKVLAVLGYVLPFLFFVPLISERKKQSICKISC